MDCHSVCGGVAFLLPLLPQSVYNVRYGNSLSEPVLLGNKCLFVSIKLLLTDSSRVAFPLHLI